MRTVNPHYIALGVLGVLLLAALAFILAGGSGQQDRLGDDEAAANVQVEDPEARCAKAANYARIKQEILKRAGQSGEADQEAFAQLSKFAVLRAETPVLRGYDQRTNGASCSAYVSIDLPPGVEVPGGRRTLTAEVAYVLQGDQLSVTDGEALIAPLSKVAKVQGPPAPVEVSGGIPAGPAAEGPGIDIGQSDSAGREAGPATVYPGRPSFNCDHASTRGEVAVCQSSSLSALDVNMAAQYRRAVGSANPQQRAILAQTRDRFLSYRDNCPTIGCIRDAYVGRMQEIRDIMEGRWRPR